MVYSDWMLPTLPYVDPPVTLGNDVNFLVDGQSYFLELDAQLSGLTAGDELLIAGWRISPEQRLLAAPASPSIVDRLVGLAAIKDVSVKAMLWDSWTSLARIPAFPSMDNADLVSAIDPLKKGEAFLDWRIAPHGSIHEKLVVARKKASSSYAFVGGIDICFDRFDNASHSGPYGRQSEPSAAAVPWPTAWNWPIPGWTTKQISASQAGWHDIVAQVCGPAVKQISDHFGWRWGTPLPPPSATEVILHPLVAMSGPRTALAPGINTAADGPHVVQVLETVPCDVFPNRILPSDAIWRAQLKAIQKAKHFIYIEDQYLWPSMVTDALRAAAARGVYVIIVTSIDFDVPLVEYIHACMRSDTFSHIARDEPKFVRMCGLGGLNGNIYVHSKLMIVDDIFVLVGSANLNYRSQTSDLELQLGIYDQALVQGTMGGAKSSVGKSIRDLRKQLWAEHLGVPEEAVEDPIASVDLWPGAAGGPAKGKGTGKAVGIPVNPNPDPNLVRLDLAVYGAAAAAAGVELFGTTALGPIAAAISALADPYQFANDLLNPLHNC